LAELELNVRRQIQSVVSHREMRASEPPMARYLALGERETEIQLEVWA